MSQKIDILSQFLGTPKRIDRNGNAYFTCPFCSHHNPKFTVNVEKRVYNCFHCEVKGRSLGFLLKKMNVPNIEQYIKIFNEEKKTDIEDINNIFGKEVVTKKKVMIPKGYENIFKI